MKQILFSLIVFQFLFLYPSLKNAHAEVYLKIKTNNIPANAIPYKNSWYCKSGYKRLAGSCIEIPIKIPANAYQSGSTWFCKEGYKKFGDICTQENTLISKEVKKISSIDRTNISNESDQSICSWFDLKNIPEIYINEAKKRNLSCNGRLLNITNAKDSFDSKTIKIPANAIQYKNSWYCKTGYKKIGGSCTKIVSNAIKIPANAHASSAGSIFICNTNYYRNANGTGCLKVPENASASYKSKYWTCNTGYKKVGNSCTEIVSNAIKIPSNAYKTGNTWSCNTGYKKVGNSCTKIVSNTENANINSSESDISKSEYLVTIFWIISLVIGLVIPKSKHIKFLAVCFSGVIYVFLLPIAKKINTITFNYDFLAFIVLFFLFFWYIVNASSGGRIKKCAWCKSKKLKFISGRKGSWEWKHSNQDGSRDKRRKNNVEQASYISEFKCKKCNATTDFFHKPSASASKRKKILKRQLVFPGNGKRKGFDYESPKFKS